MNCCKTQLNPVAHSESVNFGIVAESEGEYTFLISFLDSKFKRKATFGIGDDLICPGPWNEKHTYQVSITDPAGQEVVNAENNNCPNWIFSTYLLTNSECNGNECDDNSDSDDYYY